uniref:EF-hand domain-containing protein n=1 Tax=Romanomermis culicivorax TaxID=13658 RepID=A0A915KEV1_ROMCU
KLLDEDAEYFKSADLDQDEKLSKVEYAAFQNPEHHQHMHDSVIRSTLNERDANKDGFIDINEFLGDYADKKDSEWYTAEKSRFVEQYDSNRDGKLNKDEMKKWLIPDMSDAAREETRHLFDEADKNRDGQLTIDEIVDAYSIFVGSEATNYGEHLTRHVEL